MTREPNPYAKEPALTVNKAVLMAVPSVVAEDVLDGPDVVDAQHQKNADIHVSSTDREKWNGVSDSIDGKLEELQLNIEGVSDSVDAKLDDLQVNILGEEFEDTLHWSDPTVETERNTNCMNDSPIPGFEEPVERDGYICALRLFNRQQKANTWVGAAFEYYCIFTAYNPNGEITGTTRGMFVITEQDAYVEFDTPLNVSAGGKVKFEFGLYHLLSHTDYGVGNAAALGIYYMTMGWVVKKVGARLLEGKPGGATPTFLPEILDRTIYRTIYYKTPGAVDEKIAEHAADAAARTTEVVENMLADYTPPEKEYRSWLVIASAGYAAQIKEEWSLMGGGTVVAYLPTETQTFTHSDSTWEQVTPRIAAIVYLYPEGGCSGYCTTTEMKEYLISVWGTEDSIYEKRFDLVPMV